MSYFDAIRQPLINGYFCLHAQRPMPAPKLPALFSLFRQHGVRGFDFPTRYYDAGQEARNERRKRSMAEAGMDMDRATQRDRFAQRLKHSWHRPSSDRSHLLRLVLIMGMVCVILYFILKGFGLLDQNAWPI